MSYSAGGRKAASGGKKINVSQTATLLIKALQYEPTVRAVEPPFTELCLPQPLDRRIPENPKYKHIRSTLDTGASVSRYQEHVEEIRKSTQVHFNLITRAQS